MIKSHNLHTHTHVHTNIYTYIHTHTHMIQSSVLLYIAPWLFANTRIHVPWQVSWRLTIKSELCLRFNARLLLEIFASGISVLWKRFTTRLQERAWDQLERENNCAPFGTLGCYKRQSVAGRETDNLYRATYTIQSVANVPKFSCDKRINISLSRLIPDSITRWFRGHKLKMHSKPDVTRFQRQLQAHLVYICVE